MSGLPGAGTTTVSRLVAADLDLAHVHAGEIFRAMAGDRNMTVTQFGRYVESHPEVDTELDRRMGERARDGRCLLEARLAGWVVRNEGIEALTVWVDAEPSIRAERLARREKISIHQADEDNAEREASERQRYQDFYGIDLRDLSIYDLVLESSTAPPDDLAAAIGRAARSRW